MLAACQAREHTGSARQALLPCRHISRKKWSMVRFKTAPVHPHKNPCPNPHASGHAPQGRAASPREGLFLKLAALGLPLLDLLNEITQSSGNKQESHQEAKDGPVEVCVMVYIIPHPLGLVIGIQQV